jgi:hypothetical protein
MIVYKYRPIDKYTLELLINNEFHFSFPENFNDPFDCYVNWDYTASPEKYKEWVDSKNTFPYEFKAKMYELIDKGIFSEYLKEYSLVQEKKREILVLSFSKINDNILLWSHYADCHKGVSFGFLSEKIENFDSLEFEQKMNFQNIFKDNENLAALHKIIYEYNDTRFRYFEDDFFVHTKILGNKSPDWKYEEEYRVYAMSKYFKYNGAVIKNIKFPTKILKEIIFGIKASKEDKKTIRSIVKNKGYDVNFFQCERKTDEYGLNIVPID